MQISVESETSFVDGGDRIDPETEEQVPVTNEVTSSCPAVAKIETAHRVRGWIQIAGSSLPNKRTLEYCAVRDHWVIQILAYTFDADDGDVAASDRALADILDGLHVDLKRQLVRFARFAVSPVGYGIDGYLTSRSASDSIGGDLYADGHLRIVGGVHHFAGLVGSFDFGWGSGGGVAAGHAGGYAGIAHGSLGLVVDATAGARERGIHADSGHYRISGYDLAASLALTRMGKELMLGARGTIGDTIGAGTWSRVEVDFGVAIPILRTSFSVVGLGWERDPGATTYSLSSGVAF
jgi:hypothetical protein